MALSDRSQVIGVSVAADADSVNGGITAWMPACAGMTHLVRSRNFVNT
jgi:hypothetical protein